MKENVAETRRELANQLVNSLYGYTDSSKAFSFNVAHGKDNCALCFSTITEYDKLPGFIYADTDSIHCGIPSEEIIGISVPSGILLVDTDYKNEVIE